MKRLMGSMICFGVLLLTISSNCSGVIRIVTYNLNSGVVRTGFEDIIEEIGVTSKNGIAKPVDILLLQEMSSSGVNLVRDKLNTLYAGDPDYVYASIGVLSNSDSGAVYNTQSVIFLGQDRVTTAGPRDTARYHFGLVGYTNSESQFYIYNSHLKAGSDSSDKNTRFYEVEDIRDDSNGLGPDAKIIYAGDMNLYGNYSSPSYTEPAWGEFVSSGDGQAFDPINRVGNWHNYIIFQDVHTQNPGLNFVGGGMDDRFDFQLVTAPMQNGEGFSYIGPNAGDCPAGEESYHAFGNDGSHYWFSGNGRVSTGSAAPYDILQKLETVSDHLPVVADYQVPAKMDAWIVDSVPAPRVLSKGAAYTVEVHVENTAEAPVSVGADELDYEVYRLAGCSGGGYGALPAGFVSADIGSPDTAGSADYKADTDTFRVEGAGNISGTSDAFHFAYEMKSGDFDLRRRIASFDGVNNDAKAGVMIRDHTGAGAPYAMMYFTPEGKTFWQSRGVENGGVGFLILGSSGVNLPYWVRLVRTGSLIQGYDSPDGTNWTIRYQVNFSTMSDPVYAGMAAASNAPGQTAKAVFGEESTESGTLVASGNDAALGAEDITQAALDTSTEGEWGSRFTISSNSSGVENGSVEESVCYRVVDYTDFDADGDFDINDVNLMLTALGGTNALFDLDSSGSVNRADMDILVHDILATGYGDTDLDRVVDQNELQGLLSNWLGVAAGWQQGDMDGDGLFGLGDFALMSRDWLFGI